MSDGTQTVELSQLTAPNVTVEAANGVTYAYRRFGTSDDRWPPLLFLQHFRGNAQELALLRPHDVRRIVLAGTGPRGGHQMHGWIFDIERTANNANNGVEDLLHIFFEVTETSRALGREYIQRTFSRLEGADKPNGPEVARVQYDAIVEWGHPRPDPAQPACRHHPPHAVANGDNDMMIPAINSQILADQLPNARLRIYPDAAHGFLFQMVDLGSEGLVVTAPPNVLPANPSPRPSTTRQHHRQRPKSGPEPVSAAVDTAKTTSCKNDVPGLNRAAIAMMVGDENLYR